MGETRLDGIVTQMNPRAGGFPGNNPSGFFVFGMHFVVLGNITDTTGAADWSAVFTNILQSLIPPVCSEGGTTSVNSVTNDLATITAIVMGVQNMG